MDIPLLFEQNYASWFDETWLVYVNRDVQLERLMRRGSKFQKEAAESRLNSQWPLERKISLASHSLDNNGNQEQLIAQVVQLLDEMCL